MQGRIIALTTEYDKKLSWHWLFGKYHRDLNEMQKNLNAIILADMRHDFIWNGCFCIYTEKQYYNDVIFWGFVPTPRTTLMCGEYSFMLWCIFPLSKNCSSCDLDIALGHIMTSIIFWWNVQPYCHMFLFLLFS